jgi:hypothetical protein
MRSANFAVHYEISDMLNDASYYQQFLPLERELFNLFSTLMYLHATNCHTLKPYCVPI